jgi:hypothetical protein
MITIPLWIVDCTIGDFWEIDVGEFADMLKYQRMYTNKVHLMWHTFNYFVNRYIKEHKWYDWTSIQIYM